MSTKKNTSVPVRPESTAPVKAVEYPMEIGTHQVQAVGKRIVPAHTENDAYGIPYSVPEKVEVAFRCVGETDEKKIATLSFENTDKGLRSFTRGLNNRSGFDLCLKLKLSKRPINKLTIESDLRFILGYAKKFPVTMRYDVTQWVDEESGQMLTSQHPKLHLWEPSDFDKMDCGWAEIE